MMTPGRHRYQCSQPSTESTWHCIWSQHMQDLNVTFYLWNCAQRTCALRVTRSSCWKADVADLVSTRCIPVRCYGHPIIYKSTHKTYNKNFSIEGITSEERFEVERTVWYVNLVICPSDYDKYTQNDTLRLFKIYAVMRRSYCLQCLVGTFSKHLLHAPQDRRRNYVA
jgi:hypothetical protein